MALQILRVFQIEPVATTLARTSHKHSHLFPSLKKGRRESTSAGLQVLRTTVTVMVMVTLTVVHLNLGTESGMTITWAWIPPARVGALPVDTR